MIKPICIRPLQAGPKPNQRGGRTFVCTATAPAIVDKCGRLSGAPPDPVAARHCAAVQLVQRAGAVPSGECQVASAGGAGAVSCGGAWVHTVTPRGLW